MVESLFPKRKALFWGILILLIIVLPLAAAEIAVRAAGIHVADDPDDWSRSFIKDGGGGLPASG
jgi:hypothetical protein